MLQISAVHNISKSPSQRKATQASAHQQLSNAANLRSDQIINEINEISRSANQQIIKIVESPKSAKCKDPQISKLAKSATRSLVDLVIC